MMCDQKQHMGLDKNAEHFVCVCTHMQMNTRACIDAGTPAHVPLSCVLVDSVKVFFSLGSVQHVCISMDE